MKISRPEWYDALKTEPIKKQTFTDDLSRQIKTRASSLSNSKPPVFQRFSWIGAGVLSVVLALISVQSGLLKPVWNIGQDKVDTHITMPLTFFPNVKETLKLGEPQTNLKLAKLVSLQEESGLPSATVELYAETNNLDLIHAFLQDQRGRYEVGLISNEGLQYVEVKASHWTGQELADIQITSPTIPATELLHVIRYNERDSAWEYFDFQSHPVERIDLDGDGKQELVGNISNAVPPMVEIHRWNAREGLFEYASVDEDAAKLFKVDRNKELTHSYLFQQGGKWIIEFGTGNEAHFLQYKNDVLEKVELTDKHSRLADFQKKNGHQH